MKLIGGHYTPEGSIGLQVFRSIDFGGRRIVIKKAHTGPDREGIAREAACLVRLEDSRFAPNLYRQSLDEIVQEDLGDSEPVNNGEKFRQEGVRLLWDLRKAEIRHGDLSFVNVVISDDATIAIELPPVL